MDTQTEQDRIIAALHEFIAHQAERLAPSVAPEELRLLAHPATYARLAMTGSGHGALMQVDRTGPATPPTIFGVPVLRDGSVDEGVVVFRYEDRLTLPEREPVAQ